MQNMLVCDWYVQAAWPAGRPLRCVAKAGRQATTPPAEDSDGIAFAGAAALSPYRGGASPLLPGSVACCVESLAGSQTVNVLPRPS